MRYRSYLVWDYNTGNVSLVQGSAMEYGLGMPVHEQAPDTGFQRGYAWVRIRNGLTDAEAAVTVSIVNTTEFQARFKECAVQGAT